tara:strand:+ start:2065 stop:3813 length:1749 start_codon:yes stop_codon:yes gene_type:complete
MKNEYVLGLNFLHSDTSACIFKNGHLISAAEEERFLRIKHTSNFPFNSIKFCLDEAKIKISDVNIITINTNPFSSFGRKIFYTIQNPKSLEIALKSLLNLKKKVSIKNEIKKIDVDNIFTGKLKYVDHHESHIASSIYFSNYKKSVNLSVDGFGDFVSCAWGKFEDNKMKIDGRVFFPHSLGIFYQALTQYLGFKNYGDEYKVMGLASYGEPKFERELSSLVYSEGIGFKLNTNYFIHHNSEIIKKMLNGQIFYKNLYSQKLIDLLGPERKNNEKISQRHMDIASSTQKVYENIFFNLLNKLYDLYKIKKLTLSGGCAMNSVANGKILKMTLFEDIYISPNPGDAGGSVGSAASYIKSKKLHNFDKITYAYLGKNYANEEINLEIEKKNLRKFHKVLNLQDNELIDKTVDYLLNSKVIGWFQGKMEWGPRALGNRSIIADARNPKIKDIINSKIKRRESFRPFAPAILYDLAKEWFKIDKNKEIPFMSEVYPILKDKQKILPGITHVDGTGRLQTIKKEDNNKFYNLIKNFYEKTNIPIILNTSFNENEPIVQKPSEAIDCFLRTDMDVLVMENWMIIREKK